MTIQEALKAFGDEVTQYRADNGVLPWPPMLPYVYPKYWDSERRFFYIGRDTYSWSLGEGFSEFFSKYDTGDFDGYLKENARVLTAADRIEGWAGRSASFWYVVNTLHLYLRLHRMPDLWNLTSEEKDVLDEIGYGNLNSIELQQTLAKEGYWNDMDQEKYQKIKDASESIFDRYELLFDAYNPQLSIITTWTGNEKNYFSGLEYEQIADETDGYLKVFVYRVSKQNRSSIVIWTYHPSYLPRIQVGVQEFVEKIAAVVEKHKL